jgi:hypothetical protein
MKKLLSMIMLGIFLSSLTFAFAQAPAADKKADTKEAAPKKEKKAAKSKGAKKAKKGEEAPAAK